MPTGSSAETSAQTPKGGRRLLVAAALLAMVLLGGFIFVRHLEAGPKVLELATGGAARRDASIVFLSGDAGLARWSIGGRVARRLAADGYAVTGVDSLAAFSRRRTPDDAAALLARAMNAALAREPGKPVVLIGQSFGSDVLPIAIDRLPPDLRARIDRIILIVPGTGAYLKISPGEIMGVAPPDVPLAPFVDRLPDVPITCIFGLEETDSLCPLLAAANAHSVGLPGGHMLRRDSEAVLSVVLRALRPRQ